MSVALEPRTTTVRRSEPTRTAETRSTIAATPTRTTSGVVTRSAAVTSSDPSRSAGLNGLRGDLTLRGNQLQQKALATVPQKAITGVPTRTVVAKQDDGGALGWLKDKGGDLVGGARNAAGEVVDGTKKVVDEAGELAGEAGEAVDGALDRVGRTASGAIDRFGKVASGARDKIEEGYDALEGIVTEAGDAFDVGENIDKLGKGDKYKLGVGADVSVEGIKGYTKGNIEVARGADGKYTVSADGEIGGGLYGQLGAKLGGNASVDGEITAGAGAKVEMSFDNAEDAKRAADGLLRTGSPAYALAKGGPPSKDDMKFMADHASAVELRGNAAAKAAAELGIGVRNVAGAGLFAGAEMKNETTLRFELPKGDKPAAVSLKTELSGKLEAGLQAGLDVTKGQPGKAKDGGIGWALQGEVNGKISAETRVEIPSVSGESILRDPVGAFGEAGKKAFASAKTTTSVSLEGQGTLGKEGGGVEAKLAFEQSPDKLLKSGAIQKALGGDFGGAIDAAGKAVPVSAAITEFDEHGVSAKPELRIFGFGGSISAEGIRRDYADQPLVSYSGNATDVRDTLTSWVRANGPQLAPVYAAGNPRQVIVGV